MALAQVAKMRPQMCRDFGLTGAFANRVGTFVETPDEYREVIERTQPELVKLAPDVGHWAYAGGDPAALVRQERTRLAYLELKDFDQQVFDVVREARLGFRHFLRDGGFKPLGEGSLDLEAILMPLEKAEYGGWVGWELETTPQPPKEAAQTSRDYLRTHLHW